MHYLYRKLSIFILSLLIFCFVITPPAFAGFTYDSMGLDNKIQQIKEDIDELIRTKLTPSPQNISSPTPTSKETSNQTVTPTSKPTSNPTTARQASPTPIKKLTPTPTRKPSPTPTKKPSSSPTAKPSTVAPTSTSVSSVQNYIMQEINNYRASLGLYAVKTSKETCDFAKIRAQEITQGFNHDGFNQRLRNGTLPYSRWSKVTENLAMTSNYKNVVNMWISSSGHAANMRADTPYVCVAQYGNYFAYEGMKP